MRPADRTLIGRLAEKLRDVERSIPRVIRVSVVNVAAGAASDGNALCTVSWNGADVEAAYLSSYSPTVGHSVLAVYVAGRLVILGRVIGTP